MVTRRLPRGVCTFPTELVPQKKRRTFDIGWRRQREAVLERLHEAGEVAALILQIDWQLHKLHHKSSTEPRNMRETRVWRAQHRARDDRCRAAGYLQAVLAVAVLIVEKGSGSVIRLTRPKLA